MEQYAKNRFIYRCGSGPGERHTEYRNRQALKHYAKRMFGSDMWHSLSVLTRKDKQDLCYVCEEPATTRARVNVWGTVYTIRVCDKCKVVNGLCGEQMPDEDTVKHCTRRNRKDKYKSRWDIKEDAKRLKVNEEYFLNDLISNTWGLEPEKILSDSKQIERLKDAIDIIGSYRQRLKDKDLLKKEEK